MSDRFVEILELTHFCEHFAFLPNGENSFQKVLFNEIRVKVGIELVCGNMLN